MNLAVVWGQTATGGGHTPLQEQMSAIRAPVMAKKSFTKTQKNGRWWSGSLEKCMHEAAEEAKRLAIEKGPFHDGVSAFVFDHGWSNRSYIAKSGVTITGQATGIVLHIRVWNKHSSVCAVTESNMNPHQTMIVTRIGMGPPQQWKLIYLSKVSGRQRGRSMAYGIQPSLVMGMAPCILH